MLPDAAVGNDRLGGYPRAPLERRQLPAAGAKTSLHFGDADLARAYTNLGGVSPPVLKVNHCLWRGNVSSYHKRSREFLPDAGQHALNAVSMAMGNIYGDVLGRQTLGHQLVNRVVIGLFDTQRNRCKNALALHGFDESQVVEIKAVHDIKIAMAGEPGADAFIDDGLHVGGYHRDAKAAATELHTGIAFGPAVHTALAGQQQNIVVIKNFHGDWFPFLRCVL